MKHEPKYVDFRASDAIQPLRELINQVATIKFKAIKKDLIYKGPEILSSVQLACAPDIKGSLTKANLEYDRDQQDRDPIEMILWQAYRLGYSVGWEHRTTELIKFVKT